MGAFLPTWRTQRVWAGILAFALLMTACVGMMRRYRPARRAAGAPPAIAPPAVADQQIPLVVGIEQVALLEIDPDAVDVELAGSAASLVWRAGGGRAWIELRGLAAGRLWVRVTDRAYNREVLEVRVGGWVPPQRTARSTWVPGVPGAPAVPGARVFGGDHASSGGDGVRGSGGGGCRSDIDCSLGTKCIKQSGGMGMSGVCGRFVDSMGMRKMGLGDRAAGCRSTTDCPLGFRCRKTGIMEGVCVK